MNYTPEHMDRLVTMIFDPSPIRRVTVPALTLLYRYAERVAGFTDEDAVNRTNPEAGWPRRARMAAGLAHRLDLLGLRANDRRARRRR